MRERLETDPVGNFSDMQIGIEQKVFGLFDPQPRNIIGERVAHDSFKQLAKIKTAGVNRLRHLTQADVFGLMILDETPGLGDDGRLGIFLLDEQMIGRRVVAQRRSAARGRSCVPSG